MEKQYGNIYMKRFLYFNLYVIKGKDGDILIDTGFIGMKRSLKKWLSQFNIKLIILTHCHVDHVWNISYIKEMFDCDVAMGIDDFNNIDNTKLVCYPVKKIHYLWSKLMMLGMRLFIPKKYKVEIKLKDGDIINKYGLKLKIISLPGHTVGSIGIMYNSYLFVGDALVNRFHKVQLAYQNQDNKKALESYKKIIKLKPKKIFLGHDKECDLNNFKKEWRLYDE